MATAAGSLSPTPSPIRYLRLPDPGIASLLPPSPPQVAPFFLPLICAAGGGKLLNGRVGGWETKTTVSALLSFYPRPCSFSALNFPHHSLFARRPERLNRAKVTLHGPKCQGYVPRVPNQDDSAESHKDRHGPALQQDGDRISPRDRVLFR
jgi:hypothetical protein